MKHTQSNSRRKFIRNTAAGTALLSLGLASLEGFAKTGNEDRHLSPLTGFDQQPLPYAYNALEDVIDAMTMEIHYSKHAAAYSKNLKEAAKAEGIESTRSLEQVLQEISRYSMKLRNNAGGHYNHEFFWQCMQPKTKDNAPSGSLLTAIEKSYGSFAAFKEKFADAAKNRFGSGWAWLYIDSYKGMKLGSTPNQDNPLMDIAEIKGTPLLAIDVWEHAYYLKYQNKRADYIDNWWNLVNWNFVQQRFDKI